MALHLDEPIQADLQKLDNGNIVVTFSNGNTHIFQNFEEASDYMGKAAFYARQEGENPLNIMYLAELSYLLRHSPL